MPTHAGCILEVAGIMKNPFSASRGKRAVAQGICCGKHGRHWKWFTKRVSRHGPCPLESPTADLFFLFTKKSIVNASFMEARMRLTTHTDYALRVLIALAATDSRLMTIEELAERHSVSRNH